LYGSEVDYDLAENRFKNLLAKIRKKAPNLIVLIDFPDFNLRLAKVAKAAGIKVLYYISPKVWAWRSGRAKTIAQRVDRLALIFPFEPQIYEPFGVPADYVGNPLLDEFVENQPRGNLRGSLAIAEDAQVVGIFPGSRNSEIDHILETLIETAVLLQKERPQLKFVVPIAPSLSRQRIEDEFAGRGLVVSFVDENIYEVAAACDAILTVSGTVTLQIALVGTPLAILYKISPLSYAIGRRLIKIEFAGLPNIVAGQGIIREFIQDAADPAAMCCELLRLLEDKDYRKKKVDDLSAVKRTLGVPGCSSRVAAIIAEMTT